MPTYSTYWSCKNININKQVKILTLEQPYQIILHINHYNLNDKIDLYD